jgi:exonuclease SbcC
LADRDALLEQTRRDLAAATDKLREQETLLATRDNAVGLAEQDRDTARREVSLLEEELAAVKAERDSHQVEREAAQASAAALMGDRDRTAAALGDAQRELEAARQGLAERDAELVSVREQCRAATAERLAIQADFARLDEQGRAHAEADQALTAERDQARQRVQELEATLAERDREAQDHAVALCEAQAEIAAAKAQVAEQVASLQEALDHHDDLIEQQGVELEAANLRGNGLQQALAARERELAQVRVELAALSARHDEVVLNLAAREQTVADLRQAVAAAERQTAEQDRVIDSLRRGVDSSTEHCQRLELALVERERAVENLRRKLSVFVKDTEIDVALTNYRDTIISSLQDRLKQAEDRVQNVSDETLKLSDALAKIDTLDALVAQRQGELDTARWDLEAVTERVHDLERQIERADQTATALRADNTRLGEANALLEAKLAAATAALYATREATTTSPAAPDAAAEFSLDLERDTAPTPLVKEPEAAPIEPTSDEPSDLVGAIARLAVDGDTALAALGDRLGDDPPSGLAMGMAISELDELRAHIADIPHDAQLPLQQALAALEAREQALAACRADVQAQHSAGAIGEAELNQIEAQLLAERKELDLARADLKRQILSEPTVA